MSIIVLGTVALDTVETPSGKKRHMLGGSAVHFSMSARLFTEVNLVAVIGDDFPDRYIKFLRRKGIVLKSLIRDKGKTFKWEGRYTGDLNTAITLRTELGVLSGFKPVVCAGQRNIKNVFLANVDPDMQRYLLSRLCAPQLVGLDSMNYWIKNKRKALLRILKMVNIYVANDQEARDLSGEVNLISAAKRLHSFGPEIVLIKKGEHGVFLYSDQLIFSLPAYPIDNVIDPTGAGDTFAGGFMGCLAKSGRVTPFVLKKAVVYGAIAASFNVEGFGVDRTASLTIDDLERRMFKFKGYVLF